MHQPAHSPGQLPSRRAVAAMEFALIAPVMGIIMFGALDLGRAYIAWQEVNYAAEAVVQAAEKLSVVSTNSSPPSLTLTQMQAAMSSVYAEMPGLDYGNGDGWLGRGAYAVTLSEVVFTQPNNTLCTTTAGCAAQTPYTYWSSYLQEGGKELNQPPAVQSATLLRPCFKALTPVAYWPNNATQLNVMITPTMDVQGSGTNASIALTPQLVADVSYTFYPFFGVFLPTAGVTFRGSATLPTPIGSTTQPVFALSTGTGNVTPCPNIEALFPNAPPS